MQRREVHRPSFRELPYVMKKHWATRLHYDLRLAWNGVLLSWALPDGPSCCVGEAREAIEMEDHREANLLFEGVHRTGPILVWDRGTWEADAEAGNMLASLDRGLVRFKLRGEKLHGLFTLSRRNLATRGRRPVWILRKEADVFRGRTVSRCVLKEQPNSICTGRTVEEVVRDWNRSKPVQATLFAGL